MTGYLLVMGWLATIVLGLIVIIVALIVLITVVTRPRKAAVDDAVQMLRRWDDEKLTAALERILREGDGRG